MSEIATLIVGSEKLTNIFGRWPSFHDAEVHEVHLERDHVDTYARVHEFPRLTVRVHLWVMTNDVDQKGYYVLTNHTLVRIGFYDVDNFDPSFGIDATFTCQRIEIIEAVRCDAQGAPVL